MSGSGNHTEAGTEVMVARPRAVDVVAEAMSPESLVRQVGLIQDVMHRVMHKGEHFDVIPGTNQRPSLLKPGAEKLSMTFRLAPHYQVERVDHPNGHREFIVTALLTHIPSGQVVGEGVGSCSTLETKYRYRKAEQTCPKCGKSTIIKGKQQYGGGWLCFAKKGGCGAKFADGDKDIENQNMGRVEFEDPADYYNCVTPDTRLLTRDLRWVPAGDIHTGELLIGVDQEAGEYGRNLAVGIATVHGRRTEDLFEVRFNDGRIVRCNGEHRWLVKKVGLKGAEWISTVDILAEFTKPTGRPRKWSVLSLCTPWAAEDTREAGYIAGLLDADGSLGITQQLQVVFAQQDNTVLDAFTSLLSDRGYQVGRYEHGASGVFQTCLLGGFPEQIRFLGTIRPPRLLDRWARYHLSSRRLEVRGAAKPVGIDSITPAGRGEIVLLGTSTKTYIAEGCVCHNTVLKMAKKRAHVDAVLTATAASDIFTQDVEDLPREDLPAEKEPRQPDPTTTPPQGSRSAPKTSTGKSSSPTSGAARPGPSKEASESDAQKQADAVAMAEGLGITEVQLDNYCKSNLLKKPLAETTNGALVALIRHLESGEVGKWLRA